MTRITGSGDVSTQQAALPEAKPLAVGQGLGRDSVVKVETAGSYLGNSSAPTSSDSLPRDIALRERVTKVIPDEAFELILSRSKPSEIKQTRKKSRRPAPPVPLKPSSLAKPSASTSEKQSLTSEKKPQTSGSDSPLQSIDNSDTSKKSPGTGVVSLQSPVLPESASTPESSILPEAAQPATSTETEYETQIAEVRFLSDDDDVSVQGSSQSNLPESAELTVDTIQAVVQTTNQLVSETESRVETGSAGDTVFPIRSDDLKQALSTVARENDLPDVSEDPEAQALLEKYLTVQLNRKGVETVKVESTPAPQLAVAEESIEIPPVITSSRPKTKTARLPKALRGIVDGGLKAKDQKTLDKHYGKFMLAVADHVRKNYEGTPPRNVQDAFYKAMIQLGTHGNYLKEVSVTIEGVTRQKPQNKKKLALQASTLAQISQAGADKDESMVGSVTSTVTRKGLLSPQQQDYLFRTCMGLEPVSGLGLQADLKTNLKEIDRALAKLEDPSLDETEQQKVAGGSEISSCRG